MMFKKKLVALIFLYYFPLILAQNHTNTTTTDYS